MCAAGSQLRELRLLFDSLAVQAADPRIPGVRYRRSRTVAFDGLLVAALPGFRAQPGLARAG